MPNKFTKHLFEFDRLQEIHDLIYVPKGGRQLFTFNRNPCIWLEEVSPDFGDISENIVNFNLKVWNLGSKDLLIHQVDVKEIKLERENIEKILNNKIVKYDQKKRIVDSGSSVNIEFFCFCTDIGRYEIEISLLSNDIINPEIKTKANFHISSVSKLKPFTINPIIDFGSISHLREYILNVKEKENRNICVAGSFTNWIPIELEKEKGGFKGVFSLNDKYYRYRLLQDIFEIPPRFGTKFLVLQRADDSLILDLKNNPRYSRVLRVYNDEEKDLKVRFENSLKLFSILPSEVIISPNDFSDFEIRFNLSKLLREHNGGIKESVVLKTDSLFKEKQNVPIKFKTQIEEKGSICSVTLRPLEKREFYFGEKVKFNLDIRKIGKEPLHISVLDPFNLELLKSIEITKSSHHEVLNIELKNGSIISRDEINERRSEKTLDSLDVVEIPIRTSSHLTLYKHLSERIPMKITRLLAGAYKIEKTLFWGEKEDLQVSIYRSDGEEVWLTVEIDNEKIKGMSKSILERQKLLKPKILQDSLSVNVNSKIDFPGNKGIPKTVEYYSELRVKERTSPLFLSIPIRLAIIISNIDVKLEEKKIEYYGNSKILKFIIFNLIIENVSKYPAKIFSLRFKNRYRILDIKKLKEKIPKYSSRSNSSNEKNMFKLRDIKIIKPNQKRIIPIKYSPSLLQRLITGTRLRGEIHLQSNDPSKNGTISVKSYFYPPLISRKITKSLFVLMFVLLLSIIPAIKPIQVVFNTNLNGAEIYIDEKLSCDVVDNIGITYLNVWPWKIGFKGYNVSLRKNDEEWAKKIYLMPLKKRSISLDVCTLYFTTDVENGIIYLDDNEVTSFSAKKEDEILELKVIEGRGKLDLEVNGRKIRKKILVKPDSINRENMKVMGGIRIDSNPKGADVILDGENIGQTPLYQKIVKGIHKIELVYMRGNEQLSWKSKVKINEGEIKDVGHKWELN